MNILAYTLIVFFLTYYRAFLTDNVKFVHKFKASLFEKHLPSYGLSFEPYVVANKTVTFYRKKLTQELTNYRDVVLYTLNNQTFQCDYNAINYTKSDENRIDSGSVTSVEYLAPEELQRYTAYAKDLLKNYEEFCIKITESWWTYNFCYNKKIVQYHEEGIKDEEIRETSLGSYEEDSFTLKDGYIEQKYIIGKYCKEIDAFRSTVVKIMCSKGGVEKITIYEENICNYVLILQTKDLCNHILYAEEINEESVKISCRPLLNDLDYKNHVNNNKMKFIHYLKNNKYDKWADKFNHLSDKDKKIIKQELIFKRRHFENTVLTLKSVDISKILTILQVYYDFIDDLNKYILMSPIENIFQTVFNMKFNSSSPILAQRKINIVAAQADRETQKLIKKINVKINYLIEFLDITFDMDKNFFYRKSAYERYSDMYKFYLDEIND